MTKSKRTRRNEGRTGSRRLQWLLGPAILTVVLGGVWLSAGPQGIATRNSDPKSADRAIAPPRSSGAPGQVSEFYIRLGIGDADSTEWDGSVRVTGGKVVKLEAWPPGPGDHAQGQTWKISTHRSGKNESQPGMNGGIIEAGLLLTAELEGKSRFDIETAHGTFSFAATELDPGQPRDFLNGRASAERVPVAREIVGGLEEQDYPSVVQSGDSVFVAYVEFTPGDRALRWPRQLTERPKSFEALARPTGGDQVRLVEYSKSSGAWSKPVAVSGIHQDVYRTAIAMDGEGRLWVFWAANVRGNFDIYGRYRRDNSWSEEMRLTEDLGPDLNPTAATDSNGAIWLAWQGYRRDNFDIFVMRQHGGGFAKEERVSTSGANDWDPQIAAGRDGEVAVAWDTYDKGDYDVYLRRMRFSNRIGMDTALPIAATQKFEVRPSVIYDREGRIWVAYEESFRRWGKAFGVYSTTGSGLYPGSTIRLKVINGHDYFQTIDRVEDVIETAAEPEPKKPAAKAGAPKPATPPEELDLPDPDLAKDRRPGSRPYPPPGDAKGFPRLATDSQGIVFLAYRRSAKPRQTGSAPTWFEQLVYFDGREWVGPTLVPHSDNILDEEPALVATAPGDLTAVYATDHRFSAIDPGSTSWATQDGFNNDLFAAELHTRSLVRAPQLIGIRPAVREAPEADAALERDQIAAARSYRAHAGRDTVQLLRGDFHRYTEWGEDGARESALVDAYRYMLDAAGLDWSACCDSAGPSGREYQWWTNQKLADVFHIPGRFVAMFGYERSAAYPEGSRSVIMARRGIRPLPQPVKAAAAEPGPFAQDLQMLDDYLRRFEAVAAAHTTTTEMGTDWRLRGSDPKADLKLEPLVELYEGDAQNYEMAGAPRAPSEQDAVGGWKPAGFISAALQKGYRLAFGASSGPVSTHMAYCNLWVTASTRIAVMEALRKRHVYASTDNIVADVSCDNHFMGDEFRIKGAPVIRVKLIGTDVFSRVRIIKDGKEVYVGDPKSKTVDFGWPDKDVQPGVTAYYYVRGEQANGELVWSSPMWITVE